MKPQNVKPIFDARQLALIYTLGDSEVIGIDRLDIKIAVGERVVFKGNSGSSKCTCFLRNSSYLSIWFAM